MGLPCEAVWQSSQGKLNVTEYFSGTRTSSEQRRIGVPAHIDRGWHPDSLRAPADGLPRLVVRQIGSLPGSVVLWLCLPARLQRVAEASTGRYRLSSLKPVYASQA